MSSKVFWHREIPDLEEEGSTEEGKLWLIRELRGRNFPREGSLRTRPANTNILWSGVTQSGKSTSAAKLIVGFGDKTFLPSLKFHPAFTHDVETAWHCHLSVSPLPFFKALKHDLEIMQAGSLEKRELPPGSWWQLDEPTDVDSLDYWKDIARAMSVFVTMYAFMGVNLVVIAPIKDQILGRLKALSHVWIDQKKPGHSELWVMVPWIDTKGKQRKQFMRPIHRCSINDEKVPPREWQESYPQIKLYNAHVKADQVIDDLTRKGYVV